MVSRTRNKQYRRSPLKEIRQKKIPKKTPKQNLPEDTTATTQDVDKSLEKYKKLYEDIKSVPSYSAKLNDFLRYHDVHSKHKRIVKKIFPRRRIIARFPFEIMQMDLMMYPQDDIKYANGRYVYIFVLLDCFTKRIWLRAMKFKNDIWSAEAIQSILDTLPEMPVHIISDDGGGNYLIPVHHY